MGRRARSRAVWAIEGSTAGPSPDHGLLAAAAEVRDVCASRTANLASTWTLASTAQAAFGAYHLTRELVYHC